MMKKQMCKRLCSAVGAAVILTGTVSAMPVSAADSYSKILVLGDSISAGYGLQEGEYGYYDYLAQCMNAQVTNLAVSGYTTEDLIAQIRDPQYAAQISDADLICISIGGNDLLKPAKAYFETLQKDNESPIETLKRLATEGRNPVSYYIGELTDATSEPRANAQQNYQTITEELRKLNPNAEIVMQTIYNPFEVQRSFFSSTSGISENDISDYCSFLNYINGLEGQLNRAMRAQEGVTIAEVHNGFNSDDLVRAKKLESVTGWMYVRINEKDIHPNALGHAFIAAIIMDALDYSGARSDTFTNVIENMSMADYRVFPENDRSVMNAYTQPSKLLFGDASGNGEISIDDAQKVLMEYVEEQAKNFSTETLRYGEFYNSDVDGNSKVDIADAQYILAYYTALNAKNNPSWYLLTGNANAPDAPKSE